MPPGTWYNKVFTSTFSTLGLMSSFSATPRKWAAASTSLAISRPVSRLVPCRVATMDSVAGWEVPFAKGDKAQSTMSTPAWAAIRLVMSPVPVVLWVCRWMGTLTFSFSFFTREYAS